MNNPVTSISPHMSHPQPMSLQFHFPPRLGHKTLCKKQKYFALHEHKTLCFQFRAKIYCFAWIIKHFALCLCSGSIAIKMRFSLRSPPPASDQTIVQKKKKRQARKVWNSILSGSTCKRNKKKKRQARKVEIVDAPTCKIIEKKREKLENSGWCNSYLLSQGRQWSTVDQHVTN